MFARPDGVDTIRRNMAFHKMLRTGVEVRVERPDGSHKVEHVYAVDWDHPDDNIFLAVNQLPISGGRNDRRPDILIYVNGLPLVLFELKNPYAAAPTGGRGPQPDPALHRRHPAGVRLQRRVRRERRREHAPRHVDVDAGMVRASGSPSTASTTSRAPPARCARSSRACSRRSGCCPTSGTSSPSRSPTRRSRRRARSITSSSPCAWPPERRSTRSRPEPSGDWASSGTRPAPESPCRWRFSSACSAAVRSWRTRRSSSRSIARTSTTSSLTSSSPCARSWAT